MTEPDGHKHRKTRVRASGRRTLIEIDSRSTRDRLLSATHPMVRREARTQTASQGSLACEDLSPQALCFSRAGTVALRVHPAHVTCSQWFVAHVSRFAEGLHHFGCLGAG